MNIFSIVSSVISKNDVRSVSTTNKSNRQTICASWVHTQAWIGITVPENAVIYCFET